MMKKAQAEEQWWKMSGESSFILRKKKNMQIFPFWKKKKSPESWSSEWEENNWEAKENLSVLGQRAESQ